jgi:hypothetical protein
MDHFFKVAVFLGMALFAGQAMASPKACLIEADAAFHGQRIVVKDCSQATNAMGQQMLRENCEGMAGFTTQFGLPPGQVTYVDACPEGYQAACLGMLNGPFDSFYYKRSDEDLVGTKASCEMHGGTWKTPG